MKRAAVHGAVAAAGVFLCLVAGSKHPALSWTDVALIAGVTLTVIGVSDIGRILKEGDDEEGYITVERPVRPFNIR